MIRRMQATRILAVRHGETAWNVDGRIQGHLDIALSDVGRAQARGLARALAEREPLALIVSSDLARAQETARIVADVEASWPEQAERWRRREPDWAPPGAGGESLLQFRERVTQAVQALAAENMGNHIALFTHGGVLDVLYRLATGLDLQAARSWQIGNAAVNRLLWTPDSGLSLVGWADTTHLEDESLDERFS